MKRVFKRCASSLEIQREWIFRTGRLSPIVIVIVIFAHIVVLEGKTRNIARMTINHNENIFRIGKLTAVS